MMRLSLAPIQYFWPREQVFDFYEAAIDWPVDIVYLGENVCAKRRELQPEDWLEIARFLRAAGKEVVLSSLLLPSSRAELAALARLCAQPDFPVELNDLAGVQLRRPQPFVAGPGINLYNPRAVALLVRYGLQRWVFAAELGQAMLADLLRLRPAGVQTEVTVVGRLALAHSARCFTARSDDVAKDGCELRCRREPDGRLVRTRDAVPFLNLNGVQVQSAASVNLLHAVPELQRLGVDVARIYPQSDDMAAIVRAVDAVRRGQLPADTGAARVDGCLPAGSCNGYWHQRAGIEDCRSET